MKIALLYTAAAGAVAALVGSPVRAQAPVRWSTAPVSTPAKPGAITKVHIQADIQPGWHIYSLTQAAGGPNPTRITVPSEQPFELAGVTKPSPVPRVAYDDAFHMKVELHERTVRFTVPVRYTASGKGRPDSVRVNVRYQVCNASLCYPPQTAKLAAPVVTHAR